MPALRINMRWIRRIHTYLGVFFAPLLLFFVLSGWYQTLHKDRIKGQGDAHSVTQIMREIHTDDVYPTRDRTVRVTPKLFVYLVVLMAVGLTTTIVLGVYLAFRSVRNRWMIVFWLALGILVPAGFLWLGHHKISQDSASVQGSGN